MQNDFSTPVLFIIFNRPDTTQRVFNAIREAKPKQIFVAADGPRADRPGEAEKCRATREIIKQIDWACEVKTLFREYNLGCGKGVSSAITWFFDNVDQGIILEDDCLPHQSFFPYCEELLQKYRYDERIGAISGSNLWGMGNDKSISYTFSKHASIWGWATWKRCWEKSAPIYARVKEKDFSLFEIRHNVSSNAKYCDNFWFAAKEVLTGLDTWDYQWCLTCYANNYLIIRPKVNLVSNIGFGNEATHTKGKTPDSYLLSFEMEFPLIHPPYLFQDVAADRLIEKVWLSDSRNIVVRVLRKVKRIFLRKPPYDK